jgi:hypothetical protein
MKVQASMAMPARCEISAIGRMSFWCVRANRHLLFDDLARESFDARRVCPARARQPDIRRVDLEVVHQVQEFQLSLDGRLADGRRLQPITQGLIIKTDAPTGRGIRRLNLVPIVDQFTCRHFSLTSAGRENFACSMTCSG